MNEVNLSNGRVFFSATARSSHRIASKNSPFYSFAISRWFIISSLGSTPLDSIHLSTRRSHTHTHTHCDLFIHRNNKKRKKRKEKKRKDVYQTDRQWLCFCWRDCAQRQDDSSRWSTTTGAGIAYYVRLMFNLNIILRFGATTKDTYVTLYSRLSGAVHYWNG